MKCRNVINGDVVWFGKPIVRPPIPITINDGEPSLWDFSERTFTVEQFRNLTGITLDKKMSLLFQATINPFSSKWFYPSIYLYGSNGVPTLYVAGQSIEGQQSLKLDIPNNVGYATRNIRMITFNFGFFGGNYVRDGYKLVENVKFVGNNYVSDTDAIVASLTQRLSVLKGELWYQVNYGLPLTDKIRSTKIFDAVICDIITSHPGVTGIVKFSSSIENHTYRFNAEILTIYGDQAVLQNSYST